MDISLISCTVVIFACYFFVTGVQVHELFSKSGDVKRIIIGLDKVKKTACGFCFVEYPFNYETLFGLKVLALFHMANTLQYHNLLLSGHYLEYFALLHCSKFHHHSPCCAHRLRWLNSDCIRYYTRLDAENAMRFINGTRLDDRIIRTDWDAGFKEGRQYGRGKSGGQVKRFTP